MNIKLPAFLRQILQSLLNKKRAQIQENLILVRSYPSPQELSHLAQIGGALDFLHDEPDLYTLEDGEEIQKDDKL
jgi:hypothetical protein